MCKLWCRERKNVNLPGVVVDLPTLTKKDEEDLVTWGIPNDVDFIAASFVRKGQDLDNIRKVRRRHSLAPLRLHQIT
jgi:pyruvate kinase